MDVRTNSEYLEFLAGQRFFLVHPIILARLHL